MISKRFLKSSIIYTVAGTLPMASALILLPFYLTYLSTALFGALSIYLAVALLAQILTTYSFDTSLYIHYHEYKSMPGKLRTFVSSAFILMLIIGGGVLVLALAAGNVVFDVLLHSKALSFFPYGFVATLTGIFQALFKVNSNLLQSREKPETFFWSNLVSFLLIALFTIVGLELYPNTLVGPVMGRFVAVFASGMWALARIFTEFGMRFDYKLLRDSFQFNLYSFVYQLQQWVINYFDRFIMLFYLPLADVGVYDFTVKCLLIIEFLMNGLYNSFFPKVVSAVMAQQEKKSTPEINRYYHGFTAVIMLLVTGSVLTLPIAVDLLNKPDYARSVPYIPFVAAIYVFRAMRLYFAFPYSTQKYTKPLPVIYLTVVAVKVALMVLLIGRLGVMGVVVASLASAVTEVVMLAYGIRRRFTFVFNPFKIVIAPLLLVTVMVLVEWLVPAAYTTFAHVGYLLACLALLAWTYRNEARLLDPLKMIRK